MPSDQMTTAAAARRLGTSPRTVSRLVQRGHLTPAHQLPGPRGAFLFDVAEVERVAAERAR